MIRATYRNAAGTITADLPLNRLTEALKDKDGLVWVDLAGEPYEVCAPILLETFGFHPLAVDDALAETHVPKVDDWGDYIYVVLHAVTYPPNHNGRLDTHELDVFLGRSYLVTYQAHPMNAVSRVWESCQRDQRHLRQNVSHLLYKLADELVMEYMPVVERIDEAIDGIEDVVFHDPNQTLLEEVFALKRATLHLRRIIAPQREVINKLGRGDFATIPLADRIFFRDVYDHLVRLHDITESLRDLVGGTIDTYLSVVNNRMNDAIKTLTTIATLFMPLSFLTSFFGMNFFFPDHPLRAWMERPVFLILLLLLTVVPGFMFLWMRRRHWM